VDDKVKKEILAFAELYMNSSPIFSEEYVGSFLDKNISDQERQTLKDVASDKRQEAWRIAYNSLSEDAQNHIADLADRGIYLDQYLQYKDPSKLFEIIRQEEINPQNIETELIKYYASRIDIRKTYFEERSEAANDVLTDTEKHILLKEHILKPDDSIYRALTHRLTPDAKVLLETKVVQDALQKGDLDALSEALDQAIRNANHNKKEIQDIIEENLAEEKEREPNDPDLEADDMVKLLAELAEKANVDMKNITLSKDGTGLDINGAHYNLPIDKSVKAENLGIGG
jgi:hypothetical protein